MTPNAKKSEIIGWEVDEQRDGLRVLQIKLNAPPVDGKANQELTKFLSKALGLPKSKIQLARGEKSRTKRIAIDGISEEELESKVASYLS